MPCQHSASTRYVPCAGCRAQSLNPLRRVQTLCCTPELTGSLVIWELPTALILEVSWQTGQLSIKGLLQRPGLPCSYQVSRSKVLGVAAPSVAGNSSGESHSCLEESPDQIALPSALEYDARQRDRSPRAASTLVHGNGWRRDIGGADGTPRTPHEPGCAHNTHA